LLVATLGSYFFVVNRDIKNKVSINSEISGLTVGLVDKNNLNKLLVDWKVFSNGGVLNPSSQNGASNLNSKKIEIEITPETQLLGPAVLDTSSNLQLRSYSYRVDKSKIMLKIYLNSNYLKTLTPLERQKFVNLSILAYIYQISSFSRSGTAVDYEKNLSTIVDGIVSSPDVFWVEVK
jgi:hypothetical protein